ncbi:YhhN-like [Hexamita inflata]|uniref:YhhN-like n=1 Tax=Hexamita inflata TaxID=28002 RepID=A0AA86QIE6_9EUKA|nr:YhhN-like [Hexamita inflata]
MESIQLANVALLFLLLKFRVRSPSFKKFYAVKALMSASFTAVGMLNPDIPANVRVALCFYALGDVTIDWSQTAGAVLFMAGHFMIVDYRSASFFQFGLAVALSAIIGFVFIWLEIDRSKRLLMYVYVFACAIPFTHFACRKEARTLPALVFLLSDIVILLDEFILSRNIFKIVILSTYYLSVNLYAGHHVVN